MTRICEYTSCGKDLIRRAGERPGRFAQRHFCDKRCSNRHFNAKKAGTTYAKRKAGGSVGTPYRSEAQQKAADAWGKAQRYNKRTRNPLPIEVQDREVAQFLAGGGSVTQCPPGEAYGSWESAPAFAVSFTKKRMGAA